MQPGIGFILITHDRPRRIARLVGRLNRMFDHPPVVCHHDFSKCDLPPGAFPENVSFVRPHVQTEWGRFSVVEATVRAVEQMYAARSSPDWFVLLSGADYPVKPAAQILHDLNAGSYDAHIQFEPIRAGAFERAWQGMCFARYCTQGAAPLPFSESLRCFAGGQWFSAGRRAAEYVIEFHRTKPALADHYRGLMFTDESYFQTVLVNAPGLRLNNNCWRYTDWSAGGAHPKTLRLADLPKILSSPAHFARKFDSDVDAAVLDGIDAAVG